MQGPGYTGAAPNGYDGFATSSGDHGSMGIQTGSSQSGANSLSSSFADLARTVNASGPTTVADRTTPSLPPLPPAPRDAQTYAEVYWSYFNLFTAPKSVDGWDTAARIGQGLGWVMTAVGATGAATVEALGIGGMAVGEAATAAWGWATGAGAAAAASRELGSGSQSTCETAPGEIRPDLFRTGNTNGPSPIRVGSDIVPDAAGNVRPTNPPSGLSTFDSVENLPTKGRVWRLPGAADLPGGVNAIPDAPPPGHFTIGPTGEMSLEEFLGSLGELPWVDTGTKIK